jgi:hypothetical protein
MPRDLVTSFSYVEVGAWISMGDVTSEGSGACPPSQFGHMFHQITVGGCHEQDPG